MTQPSEASQPGAGAAGSEAEQISAEAAQVAAEVQLISAERVIFFSDAVAAIAITLLALNLHAPGGNTDGQVWRSLTHYASTEYLFFLISFLVIGRHWLSHHSLFRSVSRLNARIIRMNMIWLLMIVLTPFAARVLSGPDAFGVRFTLYAIIQILTLLALLAMSREIRRAGLLRPEVRPPDIVTDDRGLLIFAAMFAISIPIAFVTEWAFACWVLAPVVIMLVRRFRPAPDPAGPV